MAKIDNFNIDDFKQSVLRYAPTEAVRRATHGLLGFAQDHSDTIKGGASEYGSFHYQIDVANRTLTLFTVDAVGNASVSLANFVRRPPIVRGAIIANLRSALGTIPGFESFSKDSPDRPGFEVAKTVIDPDVMGRFQRAILRFQHDAQDY